MGEAAASDETGADEAEYSAEASADADADAEAEYSADADAERAGAAVAEAEAYSDEAPYETVPLADAMTLDVALALTEADLAG